MSCSRAVSYTHLDVDKRQSLAASTSATLVTVPAPISILLPISSRDTDEDVIRRTVELDMVSLPGAYTATEAKTVSYTHLPVR